MAIRLLVVGLPAPQGSKTRMPNGAMVEGSTARARANLGAWRDAVRKAARGWLADHPSPPLAEPLSVAMDFRFPCPQSDEYRFWHDVAPDLSKLVRSTEDALVQGGLLKDDRLIVSLKTTKTYASRWLPEPPAIGCTIDIEPLGAQQAQLREVMKARAAADRKGAKRQEQEAML